MLDSEKAGYGKIVLKAFKEHNSVLYRRQIEKLTGLNELQVKAAVIYLMNKQVLTEHGLCDPENPYSMFKLTTLGKHCE